MQSTHAAHGLVVAATRSCVVRRAILGAYILSLTGRFAGCRGPVLV